jgi:hypothetical protein
MEREELSFVIPILGVLLVVVSVRGCLQAIKHHLHNRKLKLRKDAEDIVHHEMYRAVIKPTLQAAMAAFVARHDQACPYSCPMQLYAELYRDMSIGPQCFADVVQGGVRALKTRHTRLSTRHATLVLRQAYFTTHIHQMCFLLLKQVSRMVLSGYRMVATAGRSSSSSSSSTRYLPSVCPSLVSDEEDIRVEEGLESSGMLLYT